MPEASDINQVDIAEAVYDAFKKLAEGTGLPVEYEYLPTDGSPALSLQTLAGDPVVKEYMDGSYIANYRAMLVLRQPDRDTRERLDAVGILRSLADSFEADPLDLGEGYTVWQQRRETLPSRIQVADEYIDYQVTVSIQYKAHR